MDKQTAIECVMMITAFGSANLVHTLTQTHPKSDLLLCVEAAKEQGANRLAKIFEQAIKARKL